MKTWIACLILSLVWLCEAQALTFKVTGKNGESLLNVESNPPLPSHVGRVTVSVFKNRGVPFQGSAFGIASIFDLGQDIEILSDVEMKAYGWCFAVDGVVSEKMPDQFVIDHQDAVIEWYYGYAHYLSGKWISQCARD